ncbi:hypothetical protein Rcae01_01291 [Novipirellula caenicola]|uniref:Uncharacterized protein n=1 Tax=Novipirellula caenicola TaxID=1536901 RepID=A0ABP9VKX2_9BACT
MQICGSADDGVGVPQSCNAHRRRLSCRAVIDQVDRLAVAVAHARPGSSIWDAVRRGARPAAVGKTFAIYRAGPAPHCDKKHPVRANVDGIQLAAIPLLMWSMPRTTPPLDLLCSLFGT